MDAVVLTGGNAPLARPVWIAGFARNAKAGPVVEAGSLVAACAGRASWPAGVAGRPIVVSGTLEVRPRPALPVGPDGERSAGAEGDELVLRGCDTPPADDAGLLAAERAVFAALAARDRDALAALIAPEFVLRLPGQPDVHREAFLGAAAAIPGEILSVEGEGLASHRAGDTGIVSGTQVARVRVEGQEIVDRGHFLDVFVRREGRWVMTVALNVSETPAP